MEQPDQLGVPALVETFMGNGQQATGPVQRVVFAAPVARRLVLDPTAALVELGVRQAD